mmetsp:Transcript_29826/g.71896  ORF Transcript_29826/g.71896 Transcript_29826/m.71896 type:complete len:80 (+) Transcript_29826:220-459(+)
MSSQQQASLCWRSVETRRRHIRKEQSLACHGDNLTLVPQPQQLSEAHFLQQQHAWKHHHPGCTAASSMSRHRLLQILLP